MPLLVQLAYAVHAAVFGSFKACKTLPAFKDANTAACAAYAKANEKAACTSDLLHFGCDCIYSSMVHFGCDCWAYASESVQNAGVLAISAVTVLLLQVVWVTL
jgi:hypothetical protein